MKYSPKWHFPSLLFALLPALGNAQVWSENFNSYPNGTTNSARWTSNATDCDDGGNLNIGAGNSQWGVHNGVFTINDIEGAPCCAAGGGNGNWWTSESINISSYCSVGISISVNASGPMECESATPIFGCTGFSNPDNSQDQLIAEYSLNGGAFVQFGYICGNNGMGNLTVSGLSGNSLVIQIVVSNKANDEYYYFDDIVVNSASFFTPVISGVPSSICQNAAAIALPTTQSGVTGNWSGTGVSSNSFNPAGLSGSILLTFTPNPGQCANPATTTITVNTAASPNITGVPASVCRTTPAVVLPTVQSGVTGNWSGTGVSSNVFTTAGLSGPISLTFTPNAGQCANPANWTITVVVPVVPTITGVPASICQSSLPIALPTNQSGITGFWTGMGVTANNFNPAGQSGNVTLTFIPTFGQCASIGTWVINVTLPPAATIFGVPNSICPNATPIALPTNQGGITGNWSGPGVSGNNFNPSGQSGNVTLTFTPNTGQCAGPANHTISVGPGGPAVISGIPDSICQAASPIALSTNQSGSTGNWSGMGVSNNNFDPAGLNGKITLTFTPNAGQCGTPNTDSIFVRASVTPVVTGLPNSICQSAASIALPTTLSGVTGNWSGAGVSNNNFNPAGLSGSITLLFVPNGTQCATTANGNITVNAVITPAITGVASSYCITDPPVALPTTQSGISGNWSGAGVAGNNFNPAGLNGNITLTFNPAGGQCASPASMTVTVNTLAKPQLSTATVCQTVGNFNLGNIADPNFPSGVWSGPGVSGNNFSTAGLSGNVSLVFTPGTACSEADTTTITVNLPVTPQLATDTICQGSGAYDLSVLLDPNFTSGTWSGANVTGITFNPAGLSGNVSLIFSPSASCTQTASTTLLIRTAPSFSNLVETCNLVTREFTVSFDITGGDPATYTVNGSPAGGSSYTSASFPNLSSYTFMIDDVNTCGPVTASGSADCSCMTDAGTMDFSNSPLTICNGASFSVTHNGNQTLESDDVFRFVLHDDPGAQLGNILATSTSVNFPFPAGVVLGQTYYVSAVAGNNDGTGNPDVTDPCLSVSAGVPVVFNQPEVVFSSGDTICAGNCLDFTLQFTGTPPFDLQYVIIDGSNTYNDVLLSNGLTENLTVCPSDYGAVNGVVQVVPLMLTDANCSHTYNSSNGPFIGVNPVPEVSFSSTLCPGGSVVVNGTRYDVANPGGTEIFANASYLGCDSIVNVSLSFYPAAQSNFTPTLCTGENVTVNGTVYDAANPSGTEVLANASYLGCDSTVNVSLTFYPPVQSNFAPTLCTGESLTVNGTVYDAANPSGSEVLDNASYFGCDSTVNVSLTFYQPVQSSFTPTLCTGESLTVNGTVYDAANPIGTEVLTNASYFGCDSTVNISLSFYPLPQTSLAPVLCEGGSIMVNGTVYDAANPSGTEVLTSASYLGCDSIVTINLSFYPTPQNTISQVLCPEESFLYNGTVYDQSNPTGTVVFANGSYLGCDSIVNVSLSFYPQPQSNLTQTLCPTQRITFNGNVYDINNPAGVEILADASYLGCDSIVNVSLSFYAPAQSTLAPVLCLSERITFNGTVYDRNNPTGTEILTGASYLGCDSIVNVNLSFHPAAQSVLDTTLCLGNRIVMNGTVYDQSNPAGTEVLTNASYLGCDSTVYISLAYYPQAVFNLSRQLCMGNSITVNGTVYDQANPTGTTVIPNGSVNGCDSTVNVSLTFANPVSFQLDTVLCAGGFIDVNGSRYDAANPAGSETFTGGSYLGCDSIVNVNVSFYPDAIGYFEPFIHSGQAVIFNGTLYNEQNAVGTEVIAGGSYTGCDSTIFVSVKIAGNIDAQVTYMPPTCLGDQDAVLTITGITGGVPPFVIAIDGANSMPVTAFPVVYNGLDAGFHQITIQDSTGFIEIQDILVPDPPALLLNLAEDLTVLLGEDLVLSPQANFTVSTWQWSPPDFLDCTDCASPTVQQPGKDMRYLLTVTSVDGCIATKSVHVIVKKVRTIFVPNVFSPNDDGVNDLLTVFAGRQVAQIKAFKIFSRWGAAVYEFYNFPPNDLQYGWDGTFKSEPLNPDVFTWFAQVEFVDGEMLMFEGGVTLVR